MVMPSTKRRVTASTAATCGRDASRSSFIRLKISPQISFGSTSVKTTIAHVRPNSSARADNGTFSWSMALLDPQERDRPDFPQQRMCARTSLRDLPRSKRPALALIPFVVALQLYGSYIGNGVNPYAGRNQLKNSRVVDRRWIRNTARKNDTFELNTDYNITATLTLTSQTGSTKTCCIRRSHHIGLIPLTGIFTTGTRRGRQLFSSEVTANFCYR